MRWSRRGRSKNLEDRRAESSRRGFPRMRLPGGGGRRAAPSIGIGGLLVIVALSLVFGQDFLSLLGPTLQQSQVPETGTRPSGFPGAGAPPPQASSPQEEELVDFVSFVLDDLQATWTQQLPGYRPAKLVLFRDAIRSACGFAQSASGPFYCPGDEKVYIDLAFYEELRRRFGAPGDFAQAYVLAHEVGHHVQKLTGIEPKVREAQRRNPRSANELSVRMELQADCFAGVWARATEGRGTLEAGDLEEGLRAASAIGDDRMQKMATGRVQPEAFTHGSSAQRVEWLRRGYESGDPDACNTFND